MAGRTPEKNRRGFQVDLAVGDGNNVGGNVGRDVARLGFDDRQGGQGAASQGVIQLGGPLQQTGVVVEDVAGIGLTSRRTAEQQGHLPVGLGLLGQIIVNDQGVAAGIPVVLAHGAAGKSGDVLQGRRARRREAATTMVCSMAPLRSRASTTWATVDFFWPMAT